MIELWVIIGVIGSLVTGLFNIYQKHLIDEGSNPLSLSFQMHMIASVILVFFLVYLRPSLTNFVIIGVVATGVANAISFWLLAEAYGYGALSIIAPLRGINPIIVATFEPLFFIGFSYNIRFLIASIVVAVGVYIVLYEDNVLKPLRRINEDGVIHGILSAVAISAAVLIDRKILVESDISPIAYGALLVISTTFMTLLILSYTQRDELKDLLPRKRVYPLGVIRGSHVLIAMGALSLAEGTRVNVVWQISVVIVVLAGGKLFSEDNLLIRGIGTGLIILASYIVIAT